MERLVVAMPEAGVLKASQSWDELSAGAWRERVKIIALGQDKADNDNVLISHAGEDNALIYASQHVTSAHISGRSPNIVRLKTYQLTDSVVVWLDKAGLSWRTRTKQQCSKTPFRCISAEDWVSQFVKIDPVYGKRVGAALLVQFQVAGNPDFAGFFCDLPVVDKNVYFLGADPHSGDHALVSILSAQVASSSLHESRLLPQLKANAKFRLFCDGSWSGGETKRRIRCMFTKCSKKVNALERNQYLEVRVGYITDVAERLIDEELLQLASEKRIQKGYVRVSYPVENRLNVTCSNSGQKGLAFQRQVLRDYVNSSDPGTFRKVCKTIGEKILPSKPLGTNEIASCIAFFHSLPAAMLPLFTVDGVAVKGADGKTFMWKALLRSEHAIAGADDDPSYHCEACPLGGRAPRHETPVAGMPALAH